MVPTTGKGDNPIYKFQSANAHPTSIFFSGHTGHQRSHQSPWRARCWGPIALGHQRSLRLEIGGARQRPAGHSEDATAEEEESHEADDAEDLFEDFCAYGGMGMGCGKMIKYGPYFVFQTRGRSPSITHLNVHHP